MPPLTHFRAYERRRVDLPGRLRRAEGGAVLPVRIVDLGLDGARIELRETLAPGMSIHLEIQSLALWDPLRLDGEIVWARGGEREGYAASAGMKLRHRDGVVLSALFDLLTAEGFEPGAPLK